MDIFKELSESVAKGIAGRPDAKPTELVCNLSGDEKAKTFDEVNAEALKDGDPMIFVCMPVSSGPAAIPGCAVKRCGNCDQEVWMSPATEWSMKQLLNTQIRCMDCLSKELPPP